MRGAEVLLIAGLSALLDAAVARAASSARAAHPPTENIRVRLVPFGSTGAMFRFRNMVARWRRSDRTGSRLTPAVPRSQSSSHIDGPNVASNTTILIIVVAMAALVLTGLVTLVLCKTRTQNRHGIGETIRKHVRGNTPSTSTSRSARSRVDAHLTRRVGARRGSATATQKRPDAGLSRPEAGGCSWVRAPPSDVRVAESAHV